MIKLVEARLDAGHADDAYLFDGFPRTIPQAELLEKSLVRRGGKISHVFFLDAPRKVLIERLTGRRTCRACGANYHVKNIPPKKEGVCDACGGELYQRPDDREATIVNRLDVYNRETEGLISRYEKQGLLVRVNSAQDAAGLASEIRNILRAAAAHR
jgi:adenylate kinase